MDNNKDLTKLKMLMNAINEVKEDEELDDEVDFYEELKEAAWNILHENPGTCLLYTSDAADEYLFV